MGSLPRYPSLDKIVISLVSTQDNVVPMTNNNGLGLSTRSLEDGNIIASGPGGKFGRWLNVDARRACQLAFPFRDRFCSKTLTHGLHTWRASDEKAEF